MGKVHVSRQIDSPGLPLMLGGILLVMLSLVGVIYAVMFIPKGIWDEVVVGLIEGRPVVRVSYMDFAFVGVITAAACVWLAFFLVFIARPLRVAERTVEMVRKWLERLLILGLVFMFPVPMAAGAVVSKYVESKGYEHCGELFELGVMRYVRGYVIDEQFCVAPWRLKEVLRRSK